MNCAFWHSVVCAVIRQGVELAAGCRKKLKESGQSRLIMRRSQQIRRRSQQIRRGSEGSVLRAAWRRVDGRFCVCTGTDRIPRGRTG